MTGKLPHTSDFNRQFRLTVFIFKTNLTFLYKIDIEEKEKLGRAAVKHRLLNIVIAIIPIIIVHIIVWDL